MIQLYRPGDSIVHRAPAGLKIGLLVVFALVISVLPPTPWILGVVLLASCGLYLLARLPLPTLGAELWRLRWIVLVLGAALWVFLGPAAAAVGTARVTALMLLASLLSLTTRTGDLLSVLHRMLSPLRRVGVDPDAAAMTLSLTITMIPVVAEFADQVREAQRARDARLGIRWVVPLMVRTLRHADEVGDALAARGLG